MTVSIPNIIVSWTLQMPDNALNMVSGNSTEEKLAKVENYLKPLIRECLEGLPVGERQTVNLTDGPRVPFSYRLVGNQLELTVYDKLDNRQQTRLEMGEQATIAYEIKLKDWFFSQTLHLVVEFPQQDLGPKSLADTAAHIGQERDWHGFVLNQCRQWAKNVGSIHNDDFGQLMVRVGRNGGEPAEHYKDYEIADFIDHIEADLTADAAKLADVTCLAVQARVFYYTDPTDWEHDCMGILWDEEQRRSREGETVILYPIH